MATTTRRRLPYFLLGLLLGALLFAIAVRSSSNGLTLLGFHFTWDHGIHISQEGGDEGEERPPVVVTSGGSIKFEAQTYGSGHGEFKGDGDSKHAKHDHPSNKLKGPIRLGLLFVNSSCTLGSDGSNTYHDYDVFDVKSVKVTYGDSGAARPTFEISAAGNYLKIMTDTDDIKPNINPFAFDLLYTRYLQQLNHDIRLLSATFSANVDGNGGSYGTAITCTFKEYTSALTVFQRTK